MKKMSKRLLSLLLAVIMVVGVLPVMSFAEEEITVASWTIANAQTKDGVFAEAASDISGDNDTTNSYSGSGGINFGGNGWSDGKAFYFSTPTTGYEKLTVSGSVRASKTGPAKVKLQGKVGDTWTDLSESIEIGNTSGTTTKKFSVKLTSTAMDNQNVAEFRIVVDGNTAGNGSTIATSGTMYIASKLSITGSALTGSTDPESKVVTPVISPATKTVNEKSVSVTITCATEGATIYYTTDGTDPTVNDGNAYNAEAGLSVTVDTSTVVKAFAVKEGMTDSDIATATYTYETPAVKAAEKMATAPADGDTIIVYNSGNAIGSKPSGSKLAGVAVTVDGTKLPISDDMAQLLVTVEADNKYVFTCNGKYLTSAEKGNGLSFTDTLTDCGRWTLTANDDGTYYVRNVGAAYNGSYNQELEYYNGFTTYGHKDNNEAYKMQFFLVSSGADPITDDMIGEGVLTVKEANEAAATGVTVIGQVVYHYGNAYNGAASINSIILEDVIDGEIYGFQIYDYNNYANYKVGDVVKVTGDIAPYGGVQQMKNPTMVVVKTGLQPIPAQEITVSQMGANYLSEYVHISNVTLGTYSASGNTSVTDASGTTNLYRGVPLPNGVTEKDVTGLYACCSAYNGTYQLRNGSSEDYENSVTPPAPDGELKDGDQVVLYNANAKGVLSLQDDNTDSPSITGVGAEIVDGKAVPENGGLIFTVEKNGDYYRFKNEKYGYLCSKGTGNNAFYSLTASDDADWTVTECNGDVGGFDLESRTAKYKGYGQWLEYFSDSYKTYSMDPNKVTDYTIYSFYFYPVAESLNDSIVDGVVNKPAIVLGALSDAYVGQDYTFTFTVDAIFGVSGTPSAMIMLNAPDQTGVVQDGETYSVTVPAVYLEGRESLTVHITGYDTLGTFFEGDAVLTILDEPVFSDLTPTAGSQTGEDKRPIISAKITNAGEDPTVTMTVNGTQVGSSYNSKTGVVSYTPANALPDGRVNVTITVKRADGKEVSKSWSFTVGTAKYQLYFGQLHSHTGEYSDGSGTLQDALNYVADLPESANVDFVAFTDHSNYFDTKNDANPEGALYDMSLATEYSQGQWKSYKDTVAAFNESHSDVLAIAGFEMTWSGGPGHINTFNTPGIVSRNNSTLNSKASDAGMKAYYALLSQSEGASSISQFNHPGTTFGTFADFAYYDGLIDSRMYMVEVGNGEGAVHSGAYFPSYEYYTMALDKGWHLAPTNNQDNHKGKWGNANDARDVILTDDFSEAGIYNAIRQYRMYATEDKNLEISYTVNGLQMGSQIGTEDIPASLNIEVQVNDPDATDTIAKVEVIVNSGRVAYTWNNPTELASGELTATLDPTYSYYYIRVTEGDGDLAVTAPVWVGDTMKLGISSVECSTATPVTNEELTLTTTFFNSEAKDATVKSVTYTCGNETLGTDTTVRTIPASGSTAVPFTHTFTDAKLQTVKVTAVVTYNGTDYTFTKTIALDVLRAENLVYIGIDASHYNEYVAGNYADSMGNFGKLAAGYSARTVQLNTSADLLAACANENGKYKMIILTAPSRRKGDALRNPYATYSDTEITALQAFNAAGGTVVLCGWGDYYESYAEFSADDHMAAQQNKVLAALGSSLRISDDETKDDTHNGGQSQRLYFSSYNFDSFLLNGVEYDAANPHNNMYTELYSQYGGASIYTVDGKIPATVTPVVYGFDTTYSADDDKDNYGGLGSIPKYTFDGADRLMVMATEQLEGKGLIVVAGAAFLSNFEVKADLDNTLEKNYSNYKICENLVQYINPVTVTDIATVRAQTQTGYKYTIEGVVTSNASGYDKDTAFFDCIYVQDATGGICCFPVAGDFKIGDKVRVTGTTDFFQGEPELQVSSIQTIGTGDVAPTKATAKQITDRSVEGKLVTLSGTVVSFEKANGLVQTIMVKDTNGDVARVFIDGYITTSKDVENLAVGCKITVTGLASYDDTFNAPEGPFPRIRVRNRADVICSSGSGQINPPIDSGNTNRPINTTKPEKKLPFTDVRSNDWFYEDVEYVYNESIMNGTGSNKFSPNADLTRGMLVTILYRIENEPTAGKADMFGDVSSSQWYTKAVAWAAENGIVNGYSNGNFGPNDPITREQLATILYRYTKFKGGNVETSRNYLSKFTDGDTVSEYAVDAMNWAVACGLINGTGDKLMPTARASRAQVAAIIHRYLTR